ncbi:D-alanyl-D-alanine carboxypeptidase/D-alanyl-D-alanine-endopeptidase [Streptacidiphilus sp. ASG 303]|uniref:D-alanyl-D-alanine carboxypeptidase/D-alanyl-D-alanine endopeptidase n=1 Tax=Streptacidiphilus sp. ASG 303 TaxID=2896847 RepID=UPI001E489328|nr:D-alanyl-D-alanine carboxypeptidase/D-alanyl-D-alanine-endopeptidase [Streptacidiphilus sp. ASG 303]MCD0483105.1 D-alanyl-D-alanine carboxypeptidase/D-alanyl-D-alanine-endopeptidase [Streptacidiphilus sp. ASG 303]
MRTPRIRGPRRPGRRARAAAVTAVLAAAALPAVAAGPLAAGPAGVTAGAPADGPGGGLPTGLDPRITAITEKPAYRHAHWGLLEEDPADGRVLHAVAADEFFIPGSAAKLFTVSGTWHTLGGDHRFTTPVHAVGTRAGSALHGDLVLVGRGDLTMGGRTRPDGTVDYRAVDHTYADSVPGAELTPEDPLAGIDDLARQVRRSGITRVTGDVVVDDRLFTAYPELDPAPAPLIVNDDVIDLLTTPGSAPGRPAVLSWRPQVAPYRVTSTVRTAAAGTPADVSVSASPDGTRITLSGTVPAGGAPVLRVSPVKDPAAFGRTAFVEALRRAGVSVAAPATGPNPVRRLPASYAGAPRVAAHVSPVYSEYAKLILKTSHNLGANLGICLMAAAAGKHGCIDGFPVLTRFLRTAGVDPAQVQLLDGRGGNPVDRATPAAQTRILRYWLGTPDADRFRRALPLLGVDGTLAGSCTACPARGRVSAKTGTVAGFDAVNQGLAVGAETVAGYLDAGRGRRHTFYVGVNGAAVRDIQGLLAVADDLARISALLQEDAAGPPVGRALGPREAARPPSRWDAAALPSRPATAVRLPSGARSRLPSRTSAAVCPPAR